MKDTIRAAIVGGLAILAVAFAAVTLDSTVSEERGSPGAGDGGDGGFPVGTGEPPPAEAFQVPFSAELATIVLAIAIIAFIVYVIAYWRTTVGLILGVIAFLGLLVLLSQFVDIPWDAATANREVEDFNLVGDDGGDATVNPTTPTWLVLLVVLALAGAGLVAVLVKSSVSDIGDQTGGAVGDDETAAAVSRAAGRAADRIEESADSDNEVFRAWVEMTQLLDIEDPDTSTPGEFAAAATDAGFGRDDVKELTRLFEDIRYGDAEPTQSDEERAVAVFRRIEERYGAEDS